MLLDTLKKQQQPPHTYMHIGKVIGKWKFVMKYRETLLELL